MIPHRRRIRIMERVLSGLEEKRRLPYVHQEMESVRKRPGLGEVGEETASQVPSSPD